MIRLLENTYPDADRYNIILYNTRNDRCTMLLTTIDQCLADYGKRGFACLANENEQKSFKKWKVLEEFEYIEEIKEKYPEYFI